MVNQNSEEKLDGTSSQFSYSNRKSDYNRTRGAMRKRNQKLCLLRFIYYYYKTSLVFYLFVLSIQNLQSF